MQDMKLQDMKKQDNARCTVCIACRRPCVGSNEETVFALSNCSDGYVCAFCTKNALGHLLRLLK